MKFAAKIRKRRHDLLLRPAKPFPKEALSHAATVARVAAVMEDFWAFDRTYFPPDVYTQGYAEPAPFHEDMIRIAQQQGVQIVLAPRDHGKTVTMKKIEIWLQLTGRISISGTLSQTMTTAKNILNDLKTLIKDNPRICHDFAPVFYQDNATQYAFRTQRDGIPHHTRYVSAFSERRSVRGYARAFGRPERLLCDDIETMQSAMNTQQTDKRIRIISEAFKSCTLSGTVVVLGNNFDERSAMNRLKIEQEQAVLPSSWVVHTYRAWDGIQPLWHNRFPTTTEDELRAMLKPYDESDWQGNFQQNPVPPDGLIFKRKYYQESAFIPPDIRGVIYVDQNLALKGKGDTTAMTALGYSAQKQTYYILSARCRSFADSAEVIAALTQLRAETGFRIVGFDGNVAQESTWTNLFREHERYTGAPLPVIQYKRYNTDDLTKNCQMMWVQNKIVFPHGFAATEEGKRYMTQVFAFAGKKAKNPDDAPDSLICALELMYENNIVRKGNDRGGVKSTSQNFNF